MARFRVVGVERESGADIALEVEADSYSQAETKAQKMGVLVAKVEVCNPPASAVTPEVLAKIVKDELKVANRYQSMSLGTLLRIFGWVIVGLSVLLILKGILSSLF